MAFFSPHNAANSQPLPLVNMPEETFYLIHRYLLEFCNSKTPPAKFDGNIKYVFDSIIAMNELLKARGIKFVVAINPYEFQVNENQFDLLAQRFHLDKSDYELDRPQNLLKPFLTSQGIPFIDMLDRFRAEERQRELYLFRNSHWNRAGNELAAQMLFDYLTQRAGDFNLPPAPANANSIRASR